VNEEFYDDPSFSFSHLCPSIFRFRIRRNDREKKYRLRSSEWGIAKTRSLHAGDFNQLTVSPHRLHSGGCFNGGTKDSMPPAVLGFVDDGFAVASIDYRLAPKDLFPAGMIDAQQAVRFLRANAAKLGIDSQLIGSYGDSAGGAMATYLGVESMPDRNGKLDAYSAPVTAVADWFGRTDFERPQPSTGGDCAVTWLGIPRNETNRARFHAASALTYVSKNSAPFFIMHGLLDGQVEPMHSALLAKKLRAAGVPYEIHFSEKDGHGVKGPEVWGLTRNYFLRMLRHVLVPVASEPSVRIHHGETDESPARFVSGGKNYQCESRPIRGAEKSEFYLSGRQGEKFSYHIPIANGAYNVKLYFAECFGKTQGKRVFDVLLDHVVVMPEFDVSRAAGGVDTADSELVGITVRSGFIDLSFVSRISGVPATVAGIEIVPAL
jgi:acetyl esterase/lipase